MSQASPSTFANEHSPRTLTTMGKSIRPAPIHPPQHKPTPVAALHPHPHPLPSHKKKVYLAAVRNFSHRGLEGGDRLLSITTRDGRFVHFRMPASASAARCAAWFEAECPQQQRRRRRGGSGGQAATSSGSGREELWKRGLWGAGSSDLWMERLVDEVINNVLEAGGGGSF